MALKDIGINLKVTGVESTSQGMKTVETSAGSMSRNVTSATGRMESDWNRVQQSLNGSTGMVAMSFASITRYVEQAAGAFAGFKLVQAGGEATMFAANVQQADRALSVIANTMGRTSEEAMSYRNSLRDLGITTNSATNATAQFMKAGLPLEGLNKLGRAAQGAAISYQMMTGESISSSEALDKMVRSLVTGNVTELHTLGINVMMRDTLRENKLATGEAATAVDTHKRHLLMFNDVMEKTQPLMLLYEASMDLASKQISSSKRPIEEMKLALGNLFLPELTVAATGFYSTVSGGMLWIRQNTAELSAARSMIGDFSEGLIFATGLLVAYAVAAGTASTMTGGLSAGAGVFAGVLPLLNTELSLSGATAVTSAAGVGIFGEAITVASTKATLGLMSVKAAFGILSAAMIGWEIGKLLSDQFAIVRQTGTLAVYGVIAAFKELSFTIREFWELLKPQSNNIWSVAVNKIEAERKAWRDEHSKMLKEQLADNKKDPVTAGPAAYQNNASAIAQGKATEAERLRLEREREAASATADAEKAKQQLARQAAFDKALLDSEAAIKKQYWENGKRAEESDLKERLVQLQFEKEQGMKTAQEYLDGKYTLERAAHQRELDEANAQSTELYNKYSKIHDNPGADGVMENNAWKDYVKALGEAAKIKQQMDAATADKPREDFAVRINEVHRLTAAYAAQYAQEIQGQKELDTLQAANDAATASMVGTNASGGFDSIADQTANQMAIQQQAHEARMKAIEDERQANTNALMAGEKASATYYATIDKLDAESAIERKKNGQAVTKITEDSYRASLSSAANYTGMAGQMFTLLADSQDTSSREGFKAAKDYNEAAAAMSTAAGIMAVWAAPGGSFYEKLGQTAIVGATGIAQIAKIESTSYGGGGGYSATTAGSFSGSGANGADYSNVGSSRGSSYTSLQDSQTLEAMQHLASSVDNASVAMRKVSDGLTTFAGMLGSAADALGLGTANGISTETSSATKPSIVDDLKTSTGIGAASIFQKGDWGGGFDAINDFGAELSGNVLLGFNNAWAKTGAGVSLGVTMGTLVGKGYEESTKKGGWFTSDQHRTSDTEMNASFTAWLTGVMGRISSNTNLAATVMGTTSNIGSVNIPQAQIATAGRSAADIQKDVEAWLQTVGNEYAKTIVGLEAYTNQGEEAYAAAMRLSIALQTVNGSFDLIGKTLLPSTLAGANFSSKLIDLMGGTETFGKTMDTYFTSMFTQTEQDAMKASQATRQVDAAFQSMGVTAPKTNAEFITLVNSLDVTTESGAATFAALMNLAPAFATVTTQADKVRDAIKTFTDDLTERTMVLDGNSSGADLFKLRITQEAEQKKAILDGMDVQALQIVQDREWAAAVAKATGVVTQSLADLATSAQSAATNMVDALLAVANAKKTIIGGNASPETGYAQAQASFEALAGKTDLASIQALPSAATALLTASTAYNASGAAYQADLARVLAVMDAVLPTATSPDPISAVNSQIDLLTQIKTALTSSDAALIKSLSETGALGIALGFNGPLARTLGAFNTAMENQRVANLQGADIQTFTRDANAYQTAQTTGIAEYRAGGSLDSYLSNLQPLLDKASADYATAKTDGVTQAQLGSNWNSMPGTPALNTVSADDIKAHNSHTHYVTVTGATIEYDANHYLSLGQQTTMFGRLLDVWKLQPGYTYASGAPYDNTTYAYGDGRVPAFATGGFYPGGSALMGELGPELVDSAPGYVYRADETKALFAMARRGVASDNYSSDKTQDSSEVIAELKEQNRLLRELLIEARAGNRIEQAAFPRLIAAEESQADSMRTVASNSSRAGAGH